MVRRRASIAVVCLAVCLAGCDKKLSEEARAQVLRAANTMADANREWKKHAADLTSLKAEDADLFDGAVADFGAACENYDQTYGALVKGSNTRPKFNDATIAKIKADVKASSALAKRFSWITKRMKLKSGDETEFTAWKSVIQNSLEAHAKAIADAWAEIEKTLPKKEDGK